LDQPIDDLAALHEQTMYGLIDAIDLPPQIGKRRAVRERSLYHVVCSVMRLPNAGSARDSIDKCGLARKQRKH
jgi:hypothetical protein